MMTATRTDGLTAAIVPCLVLLLAVGPSGQLAAQDSQFGIKGLGTPGKWESVRARSTGGAFAPFDPFSPLTDAALVDARRMSASITGGESWRTVMPTGAANASLRATRFPALVIAGPVTPRIVVGGGFSTYLDRTFGVSVQDTLLLRGQPEPVTDVITSDGAVSDVRLAAAIRLQSRIAIGLGFHLLTGSTNVSATRTFVDSTLYRTSSAKDQVAYKGHGGSASVLLDLTRDLRVAGWLRSDSRLRADIGGRAVAENDLPVSYGTGAQWRPGGQATIAGTLSWGKWGTSAGPADTTAHDTFNWSVGAELGSLHTPIRFGLRGGQLPFGLGKTPTEVGYSVGLGRQFSGGRGRFDLGLERLERKGTGLNERVWTFLVGLTVRP
jgi:hypothetical protein